MGIRYGLAAVLLLSGVAGGQALQDARVNPGGADGGGGVSAAGAYVLTGTVAQADAQPGQASGGPYLLAGGMWARTQDQVFGCGFEGDDS